MPDVKPAIVRAFLWWLVVLLLSASVTYWNFHHADVAAARFMLRYSGEVSVLGHHLGGMALMGTEAVVIIALTVMRLIRGSLSTFGKVLALACLCSVCTYGINSAVLKPFFGVLPPANVLNNNAIHCLHLLSGSADSSFPSGHMALAGSFAGVFMRIYPRTIWPQSLLLLCGMTLLVAGNWHFISDVVAGTFAGVTAGLIAGQLWLPHMREE